MGLMASLGSVIKEAVLIFWIKNALKAKQTEKPTRKKR